MMRHLRKIRKKMKLKTIQRLQNIHETFKQFFKNEFKKFCENVCNNVLLLELKIQNFMKSNMYSNNSRVPIIKYKCFMLSVHKKSKEKKSKVDHKL